MSWIAGSLARRRAAWDARLPTRPASSIRLAYTSPPLPSSEHVLRHRPLRQAARCLRSERGMPARGRRSQGHVDLARGHLCIGLGDHEFAWSTTLDAAGCRVVTRLKTSMALAALDEQTVLPGTGSVDTELWGL